MKKIYLVIAGAFLILLIITSILLSLGKKTTTETQKNIPFPTSVPRAESTKQVNLTPTGTTGTIGTKNISQQQVTYEKNITEIIPVETQDFKLQYSSNLKKVVVEKKTDQAEKKFTEWINQNNYHELIDNPNLVLVVNQGKNPDDLNPIIEFLKLFINLGQGVESSTSNSQTSDSPTSIPDTNSSSTSTDSGEKVYYAQCGDQGNTPLPDGDTLCHAGCGPTTVAMISSSYMDKKYDPKTIVDLYDKNNYLLGGGGSRYSDAHELLKSLGLKTTDYLVFSAEKSDTVVPQLRKYLSAGWTFFTLASFCEKGCGHYFWITDIDAEGNIFAYDPAYGRYQIPYNENTRYPYPLYRLAFGVKK